MGKYEFEGMVKVSKVPYLHSADERLDVVLDVTAIPAQRGGRLCLLPFMDSTPSRMDREAFNRHVPLPCRSAMAYALRRIRWPLLLLLCRAAWRSSVRWGSRRGLRR